MALNREVWIDQVKEGFYPDDSFLQKATDYSQFVDHNRLHIASAGIDPKVLVNNTTYPISVIGRDDEDNEIRLDKFETENTIVRRPEALEYSYDKLESVIGQHRSTLRASVATKAAHAYAPAEDTENTPVIITTGESITGRKRLRFADILALKERFDDVDVPLDERYLVLHPKHVSDLLLEDLKLRGRQVRLVRVLRKGGDESRRRYSHVRHGERPQRACDDRRFRQTVRSITDPRQGHRRDCQRIRLKGL